MLSWLRKKIGRPSPLSQWSVSLHEGNIVTDDGQGTQRTLPVSDLRRVVVATDESGPWGADVVYLLYSDDADAAGLFPLEARGCDDFVGWMSAQAGYRGRELAKAMGSTSVARFTVFEAQADGS
jgi:hypothetical protein